MDTLKNEMLIILNQLNEIFDSHNYEHLQLLLYLTYLNNHEDKEINQIINQLIFKIKNQNEKEEEKSNIPKDISHPYPLGNDINNYFISCKFQDFLDL